MHIEEQNIKVAGSFNGCSLPAVIGDPDKVRQVLVNVVKNAMESTGSGGRLEIAAKVYELAGKRSVGITVSDNGSGISQQDLRRVFQPFFTTKRKGTGLGLSIVKKIMDAHGGAISISSEEGKGTDVQLFFHEVGHEENSSCG
jgi:signal transduction histidine kinase